MQPGGANQSILNNFDYTAIDELDPSLSDGSTVLFDREAPFELRLQSAKNTPQEVGSLEAIRCKVMVLGGQNQQQIE